MYSQLGCLGLYRVSKIKTTKISNYVPLASGFIVLSIIHDGYKFHTIGVFWSIGIGIGIVLDKWSLFILDFNYWNSSFYIGLITITIGYYSQFGGDTNTWFVRFCCFNLNEIRNEMNFCILIHCGT